MSSNKKAIYIAMCLLVGGVWGFGFLITKDLFSADVPVLLLLAIRFLLGTLSLVIVRAFLPTHKPVSRTEWSRGAIIGIPLLVGFVAQTYGLELTAPGKSGMITGTYVVLVPLWALIAGKRSGAKPLLDAGVCFVGIVLISGVFDTAVGEMNIGDILTLVGAVGFAAQFILLEKGSVGVDSTNLAVIQLLVAGVACLILSLLTESASYSAINWRSAAVGLVYLSVLSTGFAYLVQNRVQQHLSASLSSLLLCSESLFAVTFSLIFGYEQPTVWLIVGALLIMVSILSSLLVRTKADRQL